MSISRSRALRSAVLKTMKSFFLEHGTGHMTVASNLMATLKYSETKTKPAKKMKHY